MLVNQTQGHQIVPQARSSARLTLQPRDHIREPQQARPDQQISQPHARADHSLLNPARRVPLAGTMSLCFSAG